MIKKIFSISLRIGISIALLIFLFGQIDRKAIFGIIKNADLSLLSAACLLFSLSYILCLFRWQMLLRRAKVHLPLNRVVMSFSGGIFFSLFLPSTIGGDLVRSIDLAVHTKRPKDIVATVILDRLSGYTGLVTLVWAVLLFGGEALLGDRGVLVSVIIITAILFVVLLVLFNHTIYNKISVLLSSPNAGKIRDSIRTVHRKMHIFRHDRRTISYNLILSVFVQLVTPVTFYLIALALGIKINILSLLVFMPIIGAITLLPISIGGLGLRDATTIYFLAKIGVAKDIAFAMSLINFFFIVIYAAVGGLIYVSTVHHRRLQHHKSPHLRETGGQEDI